MFPKMQYPLAVYCHPEHIPWPSLLILQINVCSGEETVSFKVKGLFSLAVQRASASY